MAEKKVDIDGIRSTVGMIKECVGPLAEALKSFESNCGDLYNECEALKQYNGTEIGRKEEIVINGDNTKSTATTKYIVNITCKPDFMHHYYNNEGLSGIKYVYNNYVAELGYLNRALDYALGKLDNIENYYDEIIDILEDGSLPIDNVPLLPPADNDTSVAPIPMLPPPDLDAPVEKLIPDWENPTTADLEKNEDAVSQENDEIPVVWNKPLENSSGDEDEKKQVKETDSSVMTNLSVTKPLASDISKKPSKENENKSVRTEIKEVPTTEIDSNFKEDSVYKDVNRDSKKTNRIETLSDDKSDGEQIEILSLNSGKASSNNSQSNNNGPISGAPAVIASFDNEEFTEVPFANVAYAESREVANTVTKEKIVNYTIPAVGAAVLTGVGVSVKEKHDRDKEAKEEKEWDG